MGEGAIENKEREGPLLSEAVGRDRKVGEVIKPAMKASPSSLCVLPQPFPWILHPKAASQAHVLLPHVPQAP